MPLGRFDDSKREFVIATPATPWPWINYLGTDGFFSLISNTAGGYCFYKDARLRRLLRYRYNNVPRDTGGRCFYVKEGDVVWSPAWKPVKTELDAYHCRHGLGYTTIGGEKNGLRVDMLFTVPLGFPGEVQRITFTNTSAHEKQLDFFTFVEWCLWNAHDDMTNFQRNLSTGEVEVDDNTLYHRTELRERRDHYAFYFANRPMSGFDTDRDSFFGPHNGFDEPEAVLAGASRNSIAEGWAPVASHRFALQLPPGAREELVLVLGYVETDPHKKWGTPGALNKDPARALCARYDTPAKVDQGMAELRQYWSELLSRFQVDHPDGRLSRIVNTWNQYQCMVTYNLARSASYFESGVGRGLGFRDTNQDILGFVHQIPARARQRILDVAATQLCDGSCYHQYQPLTKKGNDRLGSGFNDDPLWLIASVAAYIKETGDQVILDEVVPFADGDGTGGSLFEHLRRAFFYVAGRRGPHALPLIGRADWNDCLNLNCLSDDPDDPFQTCANLEDSPAESVFIGAMLVLFGRELATMARRVEAGEVAAEVSAVVAAMEAAVERHGWDGEWYRRAYDRFGEPVGSASCEEGKIYVESQALCAMAGIGERRGYPKAALDAVATHLATDVGIVLHHPPYSRYQQRLGEISSYPEGYKENGGVFCHNNAWVIIAECLAGRGDIAFDYYRRTCPGYDEERQTSHHMEPYVYSQMIAGRGSGRFGQAKNSWLTGAAAWHFVAISQFILGIQPDYDGLRIAPCLPAGWSEYTVRRTFRGDRFVIHVVRRNSEQAPGGEAMRITVDGEPATGNLIQPFGDGEVHWVEVSL